MSRRRRLGFFIGILGILGMLMLCASLAAQLATTIPHDPGVRGGTAGAGDAIAALTAGQSQFFVAGKDEFEEADPVPEGLGPRFNLDSCGGCHSQPATGGTSPAINPEVAIATASGALNQVPFFVQQNGQVTNSGFKLLFGTATLTWTLALANAAVAAILIFGGVLLFSRAEKTSMDTV